ncbi:MULTISPECIES: hypothetical protein [unclassified Roseivivax]|uniref:hypothetical protein n=1 Tax=Roseivivax sp. GX 12232 TaxID=2900547 RepID=UPI001E3DB890|nr:hypothetical protein [Roseivivax sp. GX 12232]MCE0505326.1 hypothetical protein [Roseivivax sp. GX 12232]
MKAMILGFAAVIAIAVVAWAGLTAWDFSAADRTASNGAVRLGEAGPENAGSPTETEAAE